MKRAKNCKHGQQHGRAKLSDREIEIIRQLAEGGMPQKDIAAKFEVSKGWISKIVNFHWRR